MLCTMDSCTEQRPPTVTLDGTTKVIAGSCYYTFSHLSNRVRDAVFERILLSAAIKLMDGPEAAHAWTETLKEAAPSIDAGPVVDTTPRLREGTRSHLYEFSMDQNAEDPNEWHLELGPVLTVPE